MWFGGGTDVCKDPSVDAGVLAGTSPLFFLLVSPGGDKPP